MVKHQILLFVALLVTAASSEPITILVWSKTKTSSNYKTSIDKVVANALNKTEGILATAGLDNEKLLTKENLAKYDALFFFHANAISSSSQKAIVSMVESGELGLVASHDALRDNNDVRELVGMTKMYTDYMDMQKIWSVAPNHPITMGVPDTFVLDPGQPYITFTVNSDVNMIFKGKSNKDNDLNIGWTREPGKGRTFYFCPDHETYTNYNNENVQKILSNAAFWVTAKDANTLSYKIIANQLENSSNLRTYHRRVNLSSPQKPYVSVPERMYNVLGQSSLQQHEASSITIFKNSQSVND